MYTAAFNRSGTLIATGDSAGSAWIWEASTGQKKRQLSVGAATVWSVAFSPDDQFLAVASERKDVAHGGSLKIWEVAGDKGPYLTKDDFRNGLRTVNFSSDGRWLVTGGFAKNATVLDVQTLLPASPDLHLDEWVLSATFSRDGTEVLAAGSVENKTYTSIDPMIRIWNTSDWQLKSALAGHVGRVLSAAYNSHATSIVSSSEDGQVIVWEDSASGYVPHSLVLPESEKTAVWSAAFSPDDRWVLTASFDKTARITALGAPISASSTVAVLRGHTNWVRSAAFSRDGRRVVTASSDGTARIWPVFPDEKDLIRHATASVPHCLSTEERKQLGLLQPNAPPSWCITGYGEDIKGDPSKWHPKWPFNSVEWREWQQKRQAGESPPPPGERAREVNLEQ